MGQPISSPFIGTRPAKTGRSNWELPLSLPSGRTQFSGETIQ